MATKIHLFKDLKSYFIFLALIPTLVLSQDIEKIKKSDTVYIIFKEGKDQHKILVKNYHSNGYSFFDAELFFYKHEKGISSYQQNLDGNFSEIWKTADERTLKKSFLRKHKNQVIDISFLRKLKDQKIPFFDVLNNKTYYIIDNEYTKKRKIKLIEVNPPTTILE